MGEQHHSDRPAWYGKGYSFFSNTACEYYPCHPLPEGGELNCLFCYCPLYALGPACGGDFVYRENGRKDCSHCLRPHLRENYGEIVGQYRRLLAWMEQAEGRVSGPAAEPSPDKTETP